MQSPISRDVRFSNNSKNKQKKTKQTGYLVKFKFQRTVDNQFCYEPVPCSIWDIFYLFIFHCLAAAAAAKSRQLCPILCDPIDGSPPGSPIPGILQARVLVWGTIAFSAYAHEYRAFVSHTLLGPREFPISQDSSENLVTQSDPQTPHSTLPVWAVKILQGCFPFLFQQTQQSKLCLLSGVFWQCFAKA